VKKKAGRSRITGKQVAAKGKYGFLPGLVRVQVGHSHCTMTH
jgi:hypothetical protein